MSKELKLVSPIPPSTNHYLSYRAIIKNGRPMAMSYCTQEAKRYKEFFSKYVQQEAVLQGWELVPNKVQHFYVDTVFYFPRSDMDSSNYFKVMLDAITDSGAIWVDDNVACERVQGVFYDSEDPRIEISIRPVEYIGVFKNAPQLELFKSNCIGCKRYKRNCSILKNAISGIIQKELSTDGTCSSYSQIKK